MKKSTLTLILIALFLAAIPGVLVAQPDFLWQQDYGGEDEDYCYNVIETSDEGFMLVGCDWSFGPAIPDAWIIKTDENGDSLWSREYNGGNGEGGNDDRYIDYFTSAFQTPDGDYVFAGSTTRTEEDVGFYLWYWLVKTDEDGEVIWEQTYGRLPGHLYQWCYSMIPTEDGGYSMAGEASVGFNIHFYQVKTDSDGEEEWQVAYDPGGSSYCWDHIQTEDGGYAIVGGSEAAPAIRGDGLFIKSDSDGEVEWSQMYGSRQNDVLFCVVQTEDGGYAMGGERDGDAWLLRIDDEGEVLWEATFEDWSYMQTIRLMPDGGLLLVGNDGLIKTDENGDEVWRIAFGHGVARDYSVLNYRNTSVIVAANGRIAVGANHWNNGINYTLMMFEADPSLGLPRWSDLPDTGFAEDEFLDLEPVFFYNYIEDWNDPDSTLEITVVDWNHIRGGYERGFFIFTVEEDWWGTDSLLMTVTDPDNHSSSTYFRMTILPVNDPPDPFELILPENGWEINTRQIAFVWNEAMQNEFEVDTVRYEIRFTTGEREYLITGITEELFLMEDVQLFLDSLEITDAGHDVEIGWTVTAYDGSSAIECDEPFVFIFPTQGIEDHNNGQGPFAFSLNPAFPNPFNAVTTIRFELPEPGYARIEVFSVQGERVALLVGGETAAGQHSVQFNAADFPSGIYTVKMQCGEFIASQKLVVLK